MNPTGNARVRIGRVKPKGVKISHSLLEQALQPAVAPHRVYATHELPKPPPGVVPDGAKTMAMDDGISTALIWAAQNYTAEGIGFVGYQYLAELTQRPEFRRMAEIIAKEMTRKWGVIEAQGDDDKTDKIKALQAAMDKFRVRDVFREAAEHDGWFGIGHVFIDMGDPDPKALELPLFPRKEMVKKGGLKALRIVEPLWVYPNLYNSTNPLGMDFYVPTSWFVQGVRVDSSRLLNFVGREVPDILKPSYMFGGLSLTQIAKPYVDNWLRTRQSVSDMIHTYSVMGLRTNMSAALQGDPGSGILARAALFNATRDNRGLMMLDFAEEDFFNVSAPLGTLDKLQAQAQEQMASVCGIPLVVLLGITPSGLNASSDGEIRVFYDWIHAQQEHLFGAQIKRVMDLVQLSEFGAIDPDLSFKFLPLWQLDDAGLAAVQKTEADTHLIYLDSGVIAPEEVREALAAKEDSPYAGLDLSGPAPGIPVDPNVTDPNDPESNTVDREAEGGKESGANSGV